MAKIPEPEKPVETDSETEEETDEASSEEEQSESDSEPIQNQISKKSSSLPPAALKKPQPQSSKTQQQKPSSSEESEAESESESDGPDSNVNPIASKPIGDLQKSNSGARNPTVKPSASEPVNSSKSIGAKRVAEEKESEAKDAKRSRKKPLSELENSEKKPKDDIKKQLFQRVWSEDDEIVILEGMIEYTEKKKSDPVADLGAFHGFIKDNLHVDVTRTQLQDKIRRLKKKYANNKSKEKDGKYMNFPKPHEQKTYELSKHVWGNENGGEKLVKTPNVNGSVVNVARNKSANGVDNEESEDVKNVEDGNGNLDMVMTAKTVSTSYGSTEERILRIGADLFEGEKGIEGEKEWRRLRLQEIEIYMKKMDLMRAQTKLVLDVLRSKDH